ncbi:MAG: Fe-S cluster assembly ATPase SufC [Rhabdochlamydiaceae bacterium]
MLHIKGLEVGVDGKKIIKGLDLQVRKGEIHAIMGPNGAGKSTLSKILAGDPSYEILCGSILFNGKDLLSLEPHERVHAGLFMSYQYPLEIPGLSNEQFLYAAYQSLRKAQGKDPVSKEDFDHLLDQKIKTIGMKSDFKSRHLNEGFSGGEKKKNEILQMALLDPCLAILDETDSGLDIDAMKIVAQGVNSLMDSEKALLLITHYQRLLNYIKPHIIHVMIDGKIVLSGPAELALELESKGYDWLIQGETS